MIIPATHRDDLKLDNLRLWAALTPGSDTPLPVEHSACPCISGVLVLRVLRRPWLAQRLDQQKAPMHSAPLLPNLAWLLPAPEPRLLLGLDPVASSAVLACKENVMWSAGRGHCEVLIDFNF